MAAPAAPQGDVWYLTCHVATMHYLTDFDLQDLTGQVTVLSHPNENYQWVLGSGGFATVYKRQWHDSRESASKDGPPVGMLSPSPSPNL
jgi:hypothetical protein